MHKEITAKNRAHQTITFKLFIGESLQDLINKYGEDRLYQLIIEKLSTMALNSARDLLNRGVPKEKIIERMEQEWTPLKSLKKRGIVGLLGAGDEDIAAIFKND